MLRNLPDTFQGLWKEGAKMTGIHTVHMLYETINCCLAASAAAAAS